VAIAYTNIAMGSPCAVPSLEFNSTPPAAKNLELVITVGYKSNDRWAYYFDIM